MKNKEYKIIYLQKKILFPHGTLQVHTNSAKGGKLVKDETVLVRTFRGIFSLYGVRKPLVTVAKVTRELDSSGIPMVELKGMGRAYIKNKRTMHWGTYKTLSYAPTSNAELRADTIRKKAQEFVFLIDIPESERLIYLMTFITQLNELIDFVAHYFITNNRKKWLLYRELDLTRKSSRLIHILDELILEVQKKLERK